MLWAVRQLLVPMNYLRIKHGTSLFRSKIVYDFILPFMAAILTCLVFWLIDVRLAVFEHPELAKRLLDLLALMIVFYMAALAAVATFERQGIDAPLKGEPATLSVLDHENNQYVTKTLTYRKFISYLFGYLSFLSLCLFLIMVMLLVGWPELEKHFKTHDKIYYFLTHIADPVLFFIVFFAVWQLTFTSLLGIYFLTERIQTLNEPEN